MRKQTVWTVVLCAAAAVAGVVAQEREIIKISKGERAALAVPDLRGSGEAQQYMNAFNQTLWNDLDSSGMFRMVPKSLYWLQTPQQPADFRPEPAAARSTANVRPN